MCSIIVLVKIDLSNIESGRIIAIGIAFSYRRTNMWCYPLTKHKNKRTKNPKKIKALQESIFDRDNDRCILCHRWVSREEKFHHQRFGPYKQDRIECGAVLCYQCHQDLHFGNNSKQLQNEVELYLAGLYPAFWEREYNVYV